VIATDWGDGSSGLYDDTTLALIVMPDATSDWATHVFERGLVHLAECGIGAVELEATALIMRSMRWRSRKADGMVEAWLAAENRPAIIPLPEGCRLHTRRDTMRRPHHFGMRDGRFHEERLRQTSLYRPDLDLVVDDRHDDVAAYGLFWFDPITATGVVEPMRTVDDQQCRGLVRHILTAGIDLLAAAGAGRISICWQPDNPASGHLYRSVGFEPVVQTDLYAGPTSPRTS